MNGPSQIRGPLSGAPIRRSAPPLGSPPAPKRVVMRLKCRSRPVHGTYFQNGQILGADADISFDCSDGGVVKAHKIILASSSKFFTNIFADQKAGKMSYVSVPDVRSDIMKLVLLMTYKEEVIVTADQIEKLREAICMFGLNWNGFKHEAAANDVQLDVKPGKIMELPQKPPPPLMAKPMQPSLSQPQRRMGPSSMNMRMQRQQTDLRHPGNPQRSFRTGVLPIRSPEVVSNNSQNQARAEAAAVEYDSDESEDSNFTFQLQGYEPTAEHTYTQERRKSKLTPRVETETDDMDATGVNFDPVECSKLINEWVSNVGKNDPTEMQRRRLNSGNAGPQGRSQFECTVCQITFVKKKAWMWHEARHVGLALFKCTRCDQVVKTSRAVWLHEKNEHGFCEMALADLEEPRGIPSNFEVVPGKGRQGPPSRNTNGQFGNPKYPQIMGNRILTQSARHTQLKRLNASKISVMKKGPGRPTTTAGRRKAVQSQTQPQPPPQRSPAIGIGNSAGSEHIDSKKIKQLHWLYVCANCENCADSSTKATLHYRKCYPSEGVPFEDTVTKFRQGFYGKSKCPLCPRRYAANGGFMIHCGHQHTQYRRLFSHTGAAEDKLKCVNCQRKFGLPDEFHEHLDEQECNWSPINEESMPLLSSSRSGSGASSDRNNKRRTLVSNRTSTTPNEPPISLPPRSARLAQRASLAAKRALDDGTKEEPQAKKPPMRRESGIDYPPADCPICGTNGVANISQHLASDHQDLDVTVNRISPDLLRCRKCLITFAICDLLAHTNTCTACTDHDKVVTEGKQKHPPIKPEAESTVAAAQAKPKVETKPQTEPMPVAPVSKEELELPAGVGSSPIDRIENVDLFNKQTLRKAMECGVCGKTSLRLGDIANCLRSHGVHRCALCFNSYADKNDYPQHLKKCHGSAAPGAGNKLKCPLCNKTFINAGQVAGHMYSGHWLSLLTEMKLEAKMNGGHLKPIDTEDNLMEGKKVETINPDEPTESTKEESPEADASNNGDDHKIVDVDVKNDSIIDEKSTADETESDVNSSGETEVLEKNTGSDLKSQHLDDEELEEDHEWK